MLEQAVQLFSVLFPFIRAGHQLGRSGETNERNDSMVSSGVYLNWNG